MLYLRFSYSLCLLLIVLLLANSFAQAVDSTYIKSKNTSKQFQTTEEVITAAILEVFVDAAIIGAAVEVTKYCVSSLLMGEDITGSGLIAHAIAGAAAGCAILASMIFPSPILDAIVGGHHFDVLVDYFADQLEYAFDWMGARFANAWDVLKSDLYAIIEEYSFEIQDALSSSITNLSTALGYNPDFCPSLPVWASLGSTIITHGISISSYGMEYSSYYDTWRLILPGNSYVTFNFNLTAVPSETVLSLVHLTSADNGAPYGGYAPIDLFINGFCVLDNYDVAQSNSGSHGWQNNSWNIGKYLKLGNNNVRIELEDNPWAATHYWIRSIDIKEGSVDNLGPIILSHSYDIATSCNIYVLFNEDVNASTFTNANIIVTGSASGNHPCTFSFNHSTYELTINPNTDFSYGETVTVSISTAVKDLVGNSLANAYQFGFTIESGPGPNPTSLNISASITPNTNVPPYSIVNVNGTSTYNTGTIVTAGTVIIDTGENTYTAGITNGLFSQNIYSPSSSRNISITVNESTYGLSATIQRWIDIQGNQSGSGYNLAACDVIYKRESGDWGVNWWSKDAYATHDPFVETLLYFTDVYQALDVKWQYYKPNGAEFGSALYYHIPNPNDYGWDYWEWYWCSNGWLINGYANSFPPGLYRVKVWINDGDGNGYKLIETKYFSIQYHFTENKMCKGIQQSSPYDPIDPTNTFYQTDSMAWTWANYDWVAQQLYVKWDFYEPNGSFFATANYAMDDPEDHGYIQWDWYRAWGGIYINGYSAQNKCGDWQVKVYLQNAANNNWDHIYTDYFQILENPPQNPNISVNVTPTLPLETQQIILNIAGSDNTYLKKIVLHWNDGSDHEQTWDNLFTSSENRSQGIGPYSAGIQVSFWAEVWDTSGNRAESMHQSVTIGYETVSSPERPNGPSSRKSNESGTYSTSGSFTNLGNSVQYQFDWGDGIQSGWDETSQIKSWSVDGYYYVKAHARSQTNPIRESNWSNSLMVTVDSVSPIIQITTNEGDDFTTEQSWIVLEGLCFDSEPTSGITSVSITSGDLNEGSFSSWRFTVDLNDGPNTFIVSAIDNSGNTGDDQITVTKINPTVNNPDVQPSSGTYDSPITITINCSTIEATIRYTLDESEPTEVSAIYTIPFQISGDPGTSMMVKAKGFKSGYLASETTIGDYKFGFKDKIYVPQNLSTIQRAIDFALENCEIIVSQGIYVENIIFKGNNIILRSTEPTNPDVVSATIIDGNQAGSVVTFSGTETSNCVFSGFTIKNGKTEYNGGGIFGNSTKATIQNNVITENKAMGISESYGHGGGIDNCDGLIQNNLVNKNIAYGCNEPFGPGHGGGLNGCDGNILNNIISENEALMGNGGGYKEL